MASWGAVRLERCDPAMLRAEAARHRNLLRLRGWGGGIARLRHALNPLLACRSKLLAGQTVVRLADLLPALERAAAHPPPAPALPIDRDIAAFLAAHSEARVDSELAALADPGRENEATLPTLKLLAALQDPHSPTPAVAAWLARQARPALAQWHSKPRRNRREHALAECAAAGRLAAMRAVLEDPAALIEDSRQRKAALRAVQDIDGKLAYIAADRPLRAETARRLSLETSLPASAP